MILVEITRKSGDEVVVRRLLDGTYQVEVNGEVKHPGCSAEDAIRALGHYLQGS